ncbi:hypothetical protein GH714_019903 [Hevea brasiliensis]|uniref:Uncharacterized protein n=1 Tax=Hevea brasiliensis TaxID=3981 RepID=A0A6A6M8P0_HEVBR|nr:hypothetical protein GH714_019903 [Hevea brasiliensis]
MNNTKPVTIPFAAYFKLSANMSLKTDEEMEHMSSIPYLSAVGGIMYAIVCTRPNIAHVVGVMSRYMPFALDDFTSATPEADVTPTAIDLDFRIILLLSSSSFFFFPSSCCKIAKFLSTSPLLLLLPLLLLVLNSDQNGDVVFGLSLRIELSESIGGFDRRNGIASDLDRRKEGSLSIRLDTRPTVPIPEAIDSAAEAVENREKEDEVEEDVVTA